MQQETHTYTHNETLLHKRKSKILKVSGKEEWKTNEAAAVRLKTDFKNIKKKSMLKISAMPSKFRETETAKLELQI